MTQESMILEDEYVALKPMQISHIKDLYLTLIRPPRYFFEYYTNATNARQSTLLF